MSGGNRRLNRPEFLMKLGTGPRQALGPRRVQRVSGRFRTAIQRSRSCSRNRRHTMRKCAGVSRTPHLANSGEFARPMRGVHGRYADGSGLRTCCESGTCTELGRPAKASSGPRGGASLHSSIGSTLHSISCSLGKCERR